ncbi:hypothetical protein KRP22_011194 [Phytophthora ramorum]|nr:putative vacuolar protein sorting-associated protein 13C [Phytophthora ramorum]
MLQHAVALLLQRLLGKFVTFDSSMLKLSLWQGDVSFQDLQLRLSYGEGAIGLLSVKIPWRALWTQPVQVKAQRIRVSLHRTPHEAAEMQEQQEVERVDTSIDGSNGDDRTYLSRLVSHIIANVQIELSDVQVRYDCDPSSLAPQPGSGTLEIAHVSLINTNAEWELEFSPQSNATMESRKLLKVEGVAAYIEYPDKQIATHEPKMQRKYLFHEWRSTVKASLFYHSANAAFPDVELDVDIGCEPGSITELCEICAAHNASGQDKFVLPANQPRVHFGPEHIDVLYAILIEVKAPYDEYDRLAALTQQQASRPDGFLMVLSYAKQWLLTDCLDAIVGETFTLAAEDDDDDDDEFEDAITPPSLSVRAELQHGAGIFFSARVAAATEEDVLTGIQWVWILGKTVGVVKQSCVEDEIQLSVQSLRMYEVAGRSESYSIIDHATEEDFGSSSGALASFTLSIKDVDWSSRVCTTTFSQGITVASISLQEDEHVIVQVAGSSGLRTPALCATYQMDRMYSNELRTTVDEVLRVYYDTVVAEVNERAAAMGISRSQMGEVRFEVVANDLAFSLPRSSFSRDSIILRSTNARIWSSGIDPSTSDFLQNGTFVDEARLSHGSALAGASAAKAQLSRRTELRNLRRQIKNQRSRILSNRSQLFIDLRSATQQAQNYLHEGFQALPAAEDAVKIIHNKIVLLDQQLEQLSQYLLKVDAAIDTAKAEGDALNSGGRDSLHFLAGTPTSSSRGRSNSMEQIRHEVAGMSQHLMAPLFVAEDAEFHDARVALDSNMMTRGHGDADMSTSSVGLFEFELVDLSGTTRNSASPLFHHSLLTGRIDSEPESLSEAALSSYFGVSLSLNELSIGTGPEQYITLLGMIYENFGEVSRVVTEDSFPLCPICGGHHFDYEHCNAIWLKIPVKVADAALRISNSDHPVADLFWDQLELVITLRTDDSVEFSASALSFTAVDIRPSRSQAASEIIRPLPGDGLQIEYSQKMNWTDSMFDLKVRNTNFLGVYPAFHDVVAFFVDPIFAKGAFSDFGVGFMALPPPDWQKIDFFVTTIGCLFSMLEDFETTDARALVMLTDIVAAYSTHQQCEDAADMTKCHLEFDQHGVYFSQLPDLQIDASFPLSNSFLLVFDHFVEGSVTLSRRNSFVLAPVETRFSVQDANLFINIVNNYLQWIPTSTRSTSATISTNGARIGPSSSSQPTLTTYVADKLLGDVGELRLVLVNNSLGIPIADFRMREIVCEYIKDEDYSTTVGATLLFNYFNNSIYRWEPLVEPFVVQMRIHRALEENSLVEVFANLPNTVNFNMTPAMAPLLSSEALKQADFVTSGSKSTAPFWVENKTGLELKFSFRREKRTIDLTQVEEEESEKVEDDFLHVFGEPVQRQRMNPLRDANYELDEARATNQRRGLYEATNSSLYYLSVSPFLTLHNRLATAMAYRLLNGSLQLIAEGILAVGNVLPLFQVDSTELLYVSFRLENYSWSAPKLIINPKMSAYTVPYKESIEPVQLLGRAFDRDITGEQGSIPNLQLQVKLSGRDVVVFCSIWIVNHTDLDLEYCNSTSSSSKRLESVLKYVHRRPASAEEQADNFSARSLSFHGDGVRENQLTRLQKVKPSASPVAVIVVIREARELYNAQYFGAQSPYVRASLYVLKNPKDRYLEKPEMVAIWSATTKPSPSGGLAPQWDGHLQNTLLLRFPPEVRTLDLARIIIEVRNVRYGLDTCLGVTAVKVDSILKDRKRAVAFNWYKLLKRKSSRERKASKNNLASTHRGDISMSFSVGTSQELPSDMDTAVSVEEGVEDLNSPSAHAQVISLTNEVYDQDQESDLRKGSQEVALWSCYGSGRFSETIMATVVPRYILINKTEETIKYRQFDAPQTLQLAANELVPFHWPSASREKLLEVSLLYKYSWSGSFRINSLGTTYLKLRDRDDPSRIYILQCQIELVGGSVALIFREESRRFPPYRIDNMTSFRIRYKQTNWGEDKDFDELLPRSSCAYSWDYLNGSEVKSSSSSNQDPAFPGSSSSSSRSLQVRFMRVTSSTAKRGGDSDKDAVEIREYNLDEMATHKRIQLHRSLPSELFLKPEQKGYLLKKDSMLKWNRKYFRLYEHMLYYFANETDQELLGVVDLRVGSDVPGVGGVAIFEKAAEAPSKSGFISLNGLVSSISGSLFGGGSRQLGNDGGDDDDEDEGDRSRELIRLAVSLTTSSVLCEESEKFVSAHIDNQTATTSGVMRKGFYVNGQDLVDFLVTEMSTQTRAQSFTTAQEMMELGVLKPVPAPTDAGARKQAPLRSFQCSKIVWYTVDSINLAEDSDMDSEDSTSMTTPRDSDLSVKVGAKSTIVGSNQFSIITPTKCYDLKAKNPKIAKIWVRRLRLATQGLQADAVDELLEETPMPSGTLLAPKTMRSQRDLLPQVQQAKTYVHVRIRADGPTKVLELFEGGEEDFDEKESKHELSSSTSASSDSPTASETSTNAFESLTSGMALHLRVDGVGISCVNELPMELVYIYLGGISLHYSRVNSNMRMNVTLDDVQIDNQSEEATFTKLLCPRMEGAPTSATPTRKRTLGDIDEDLAEMVNQGRGAAAGGDGDDDSQEHTGLIATQNIFSCADCKYRQANMATMHFCCTWSNEQGNTDYFKHCSFWLYPVITQLDEELLVSARAFMASMSQSWGEHRSQNRGGEIRMKSIPIETMMESLVEYRENTLSDELDPLKSLESYTTTSSSETRKVYFALLHIHPMDFDITFRSDVFQTTTTISLHEAASFKKSKITGNHDEMKRSSSAPSSFGEAGSEDSSSAMTWAIPSLTMHVPDLDNAPVRLNALMIEHAFGTSGDLTRRVSKYYTRQLWKQLHKILGSFDFLGNPVGFLDHIGTGVRDFVYEPLEGLKIGGKGFSKGLAKGTASLMTNTVDGTFDAASKISGTFGQGFANLSLDDHYQQNRARARRRHVRGLREGLVQGSKELSLGVYEGVAGLVLNPMRGAQESGAVGFVRGTITGIIGLPVKPVAGIFDFASRATQGVRNRSLQNGQNMRRVRRPRVFGRYNELKCYKEADTIAYELLKRVGGDRLSGEKIIFYNEIMQSVSAADLTREARNRRRSGSAGNGKPKSNNDSTRERTNSLRRALQENDERRRAAGEHPSTSAGESSGRKLRYEVVFYQKRLGMDLETDFYCENVTIKAMDETAKSKVKVRGQIAPGQQVLQEGDCLIGIGGVDVRGVGFHETLALLRGTARPITVQFESAEELLQEVATSKSDNSEGGEIEVGGTSKARLRRLSLAGGNDSVDESVKKLKVQLSHWLIVTEQRVLYINVGSFTKPVVEWMTPLRYIYRVEWQKSSARLCLHLSVGVDSLPMGPRLRPSLKAIDGHERDMHVFLDVMWHSFGSATAEEQELWPSDTSLNGYLLKKGGFSTVRRWFVLSRNCLYYFSSRKQLRGIIPLGHVRLETDAGDARCLRITNSTRSQPLVTLQLDSGQVVERVQSEVVLVAASTQELEMWQSSLAHAAGKGMRHSRGTRFFVPTAASRLEIGTQETPDFVVKPLAEALKKTVEVFNIKLP